jgi:hypothetical protein
MSFASSPKRIFKLDLRDRRTCGARMPTPSRRAAALISNSSFESVLHWWRGSDGGVRRQYVGQESISPSGREVFGDFED